MLAIGVHNGKVDVHVGSEHNLPISDYSQGIKHVGNLFYTSLGTLLFNLLSSSPVLHAKEVVSRISIIFQLFSRDSDIFYFIWNVDTKH